MRTKFLIIYVFLIAIISALKAQTYEEDLILKGLGTTFIIEGVVGEELVRGKCPCSFPEGGRCILLELKINRVLYYFENKVYTKYELEKVDKLIFSNTVVLKSGEKYIMVLHPSTSNQFLQLSYTLNIDPMIGYNIIHQDGHFTDLIECNNKNNRFERFLLKSKSGN